MKIVALDIGNTFTKWAVFDQDLLIFLDRFPSTLENLKSYVNAFTWENIDFCIYSSVKKINVDWNELLQAYQFYSLKSIWPSTFLVRYEPPESMGEDRMSCMLGAFFLSHGHYPLLTIQFGTAITYDYLLEPRVLEGGAISPGLRMRFQALHNLTDLLPLIKPKMYREMIGKSTETAILSGVMHGVKTEVEDRIKNFLQNFPTGKVYLTGGDLSYFAMSDEKQIFANQNLVLWGLYYAATIYVGK